MTKQQLFDTMRGTVIVSCQAVPGEPLYDPQRSVMYLMARAAKQAGAKMIRTSSPRVTCPLAKKSFTRVIMAAMAVLNFIFS